MLLPGTSGTWHFRHAFEKVMLDIGAEFAVAISVTENNSVCPAYKPVMVAAEREDFAERVTFRQGNL